MVGGEENGIDAELKDQLVIWRHNRSLYPGWLVAPRETRDRIWNYTNEWIEPSYEAKDQWSAGQLLVLYRELFWRLDVALHYVPDDLIVAADRVLHHFASKIGLSFSDDTLRHEDWPQNLALTADTLKDEWVAVACHVLRHYRITRNRLSFDELHKKILDVARSDDDVGARLAYDKCVWALSEDDREACLNGLNNWPTGPADPYWQVKRSALYAELGEVSKATALMENALVDIRSTQKLGSVNISAMSRESWTLQHLWQINRARHLWDPTENDHETRKQRDRQRELEAYRCSAEVELHLLRTAVEERPKPQQPMGTSEQPPDFDNGYHRSVFHLGNRSATERLSPAQNLLMMMERTGLLPCLREVAGGMSFDFFLKSYQQSLAWLQEDSPGLWASWAPRFDLKGLGDGELSRQTILGLSDGNVEALFVMACRHLDAYFDQSSFSKQEVMKIFDLSHWVQLATRLSTRRDDESREWLLTVALKVLEHDQFCSHPLTQKHLNVLLIRSLPYMNEAAVKKWLIELLGSRLTPSSDFRTWGEPFELIDREVLRALSGQRLSGNQGDDGPFWKEVSVKVSDLVGKVGGENQDERGGALARLLPLHDVGFFTKNETKKLATALWAHVDNSGIPVLSERFLKSECLQFPEPQLGHANHVLMSWLDEETIQSRFSTDETDGKRSLSSQDPDHFIPNVRHVASLVARDVQQDEVFGEQRVQNYLVKILDWWKNEGEAIRAHKQGPFLSIDPTDRLSNVVDVLGRVLIPNVKSSEAVLGRVSRMVHEFVEAGLSESRAAPVLAFFDREKEGRYQQALQLGLASDRRDSIVDAIVGVHRWVRDGAQLDLPPLPVSMFSSVFFILQGLIPPGARSAINLVNGLIELDAIRPKVGEAELFRASVETACAKLSYDQQDTLVARSIDLEELPHLRREMAHLIGSMQGAGFDLGEGIKAWLTSALNDPIVDVRHAAEKASKD